MGSSPSEESFSSFVIVKTLLVDQIIGDGVDRQTGKRVYLQFPKNVSSVSDDCIDRDEQLSSNLLV